MGKKSNNPWGEVLEQLGGSRYRVAMDDGTEIIAYLSGKMRHRNINVYIGDKVEVALDPAGGHATNRIVWRK